MAESIVQVTEGSGKKLHTFQRTIGANTVEDEVTLLGEPYLASYVVGFSGSGTATLDAHILELMAGASLNVRIRRILIDQRDLATAANTASMLLFRLTTAGTGGGVVTPRPLDSSDAAAGATAMTLPTTKGTEGVFLHRWSVGLVAAHPATAFYEWTQLPNAKPIVIPAGTANGIAIKNQTAVAGASVSGYIEFDETSW